MILIMNSHFRYFWSFLTLNSNDILDVNVCYEETSRNNRALAAKKFIYK